MRFRSEYAEWRDEIEAPKLTVAERVAKWFTPRPTEGETASAANPYVWHDVASLIDGSGS